MRNLLLLAPLVKTGQAKIHPVVIEAQYKFVGGEVCSRYSRVEDPAVYLEADSICEEISRKQAMREELASRSVTSESVDDSVTTETVDAVVVPLHTTLINCKAVTGLATFSARIVIYLMLIRRAGT